MVNAQLLRDVHVVLKKKKKKVGGNAYGIRTRVWMGSNDLLKNFLK